MASRKEGSGSSKAMSNSSMMRLQRDITELEREPLEGIQYHVCETDMTRMCLILSPTSGPYHGLRLHLKVHVPPSYPGLPPEVTIQTSVLHPNVYGNTICCDILCPPRDLRYFNNFYNGGYTPGYLLKYIFLQLLSFFTAEQVDQDLGGQRDVLSYFSDVEAFKKTMAPIVKGWSCTECGFNITFPSVIDEPRHSTPASPSSSMSPLPELVTAVADLEVANPRRRRRKTWDQRREDKRDNDSDHPAPNVEESGREDGHSKAENRGSMTGPPGAGALEEKGNADAAICALDKLTHDCWLSILERLSDQDMLTFSRACPDVRRIVKTHNLLVRRQLVCFYSRRTFREAVLGIGLHIPEPTVGEPRRRPGPADQYAAVRVLDLFSHEAFEHNALRMGIYGEEFNAFLPLALDDHHFRRAEPLIERALVRANERTTATARRRVAWPLAAADVLPRLMNRMVLDLVKDCDKEGDAQRTYSDRLSRHPPVAWRASEKALQGYCLLFHLFDRLVKRHPAVAADVRRRADIFRQPGGRSKECTLDLGELLAYLLVLREDWRAYCVPFVEELLARNVVWYLSRGHAHLAHLEEGDAYVSQLRLDDTFRTSAPSLRLVMFQVSFLRLAQSSRDINSQYGYPSAPMSEALFLRTQRIYAVRDWDGFLELVGYELPNRKLWRAHVCDMLKRAVARSQAAGYHVVPYSPRELYYLRAAVEPGCPLPAWWDPRDPKMVRLESSGLDLFRRFFPNSKK